jgi:hypothetical protein
VGSGDGLGEEHAMREVSRSGARGCGVVTGAMTKEKGDKRPAGKKTEVVPGAICNTSFVLGGEGNLWREVERGRSGALHEVSADRTRFVDFGIGFILDIQDLEDEAFKPITP